MELPFNPLGDNPGGPIPPVDPADLRRVWEMQRVQDSPEEWRRGWPERTRAKAGDPDQVSKHRDDAASRCLPGRHD
jgi:hypothetical protein